MKTERPILKIHADKQASHRALLGIKRSAGISGFIAFLLAIALVSLFSNKVEVGSPTQLNSLKFTASFFFFCSAAMGWLLYKSIPSYYKEYQELPLLYSFYPQGFISHRGEQDYYWEQITALTHSKSRLNLQMKRNPHKTVGLSFICISDESIRDILHHFKKHGPEKLSGRIKL